LIYIKTHEAENGSVVAMCDESLIERVLEEGDVFMDIKTYNSFYKGELVNKERACEIIKQKDKVHSANIVGKEAIDIGLETGIIKKGNVMRVSKVPYAQAFRVDY
jgi:hypothetical protein